MNVQQAGQSMPSEAVAQGLQSVCRMDIAGGGQVVAVDGYAYVGHMRPPMGTSIIDVRDPAKPVIVAHIPPPDNLSHTHKVRVVGNLLFSNVEQDRRHFFRRAGQIDSVTERLSDSLGRAPTSEEVADDMGLSALELQELYDSKGTTYNDGGFRVFDISDRANPRLLAYQRTGGVGVHRFDVDENYAYISTEMEGYRGNILMIYDISDPTHPTEVSRWHMPGQHLAGGETPHWDGLKHRLHHALRLGDQMWAACWYGGGFVIDVSDITQPRTVASHNYHPPYPEPTHTFLKIPHKVAGRDVALMMDEEHDHIPGQPHAFLWIMDVSDLDSIKPLSTFHVSPLASPYAAAEGRFGAHQFDEIIRDNLIYATWFSGGLRVIDVEDPLHPKEVASYIPAPFPDQPSPQSNDVAVDERGYVFLMDRNRGLEILERVPAA